ncbi:MAG: hypothetical protein QOE48_1642, partial [Mycobacterium sp.]|nr:hypothetical protein [Mycobacterium sp.]
ADPARAVRAVRSVLRPGGELLSLEAVSLPLSIAMPWRGVAALGERNNSTHWWRPNMAAHRSLLRAGGFDVVDHGGPVFQPLGGWRPRFPKTRPRGWAELHYWLFTRQFGIPSAWARCRPTP